VGLVGWLRYQANDRAIRASVDLASTRSASVIAVAVVAVPLVAAVVLSLS
jgi:uncharacterized membrane protein YidH (DUF202 family)